MLNYAQRKKKIKALAREIALQTIRRGLDEGSFTEDNDIFIGALRRIATRVGGIDFGAL
ncbi:hypothetical protein LCGC14_2691250, partial [marine sediment metagenome]